MIAVAKSRNKARSSRRSVQRKRKTCGLKLGVEVERRLRGFTSGSPQSHVQRLDVAWRRPGRSNRPGGVVRPGGGGQTAQEGRSDRVARMVSRRSEVEDTQRDRMACIEEK